MKIVYIGATALALVAAVATYMAVSVLEGNAPPITTTPLPANSDVNDNAPRAPAVRSQLHL